MVRLRMLADEYRMILQWREMQEPTPPIPGPSPQRLARLLFEGMYPQVRRLGFSRLDWRKVLGLVPAQAAPVATRFKSIAEWPSDSDVGRSEDEHDTRRQAEAVCERLERDGLGGMGQVFPLRTWVEEFTPGSGS